MKNILVFFGGASPEREVSVITGTLVSNSFDRAGFNPVPVYVDARGRWFTGEPLFNVDNFKNLPEKKLKSVVLFTDGTLYAVKGKKIKPVCRADGVINCMHGGAGEDGCFSGIFKACGLPVASPGVAPSAAAMDKELTKYVLKGLKIPCLPFFCVKSVQELPEIPPFGYPVIVKPARGGSSIGIRRADDAETLDDCVKYALKFGEKAIVEPFVQDFTEINCAGYRDKSGEIVLSPCERPVKSADILSFSDKYEGGTHVFPADIDVKLSEKIRKITRTVYEKLGFDGIVRADFIVTGGKPYLNEINSVPGSLAYYLFCDTLKQFSALLTELVAAAEEKSATERAYVTRYDSGILSGIGSKGVKRR